MTRTLLAARDWAKPMWGAIGLYVASLVVWMIVSLVLIEMDLKDPIRPIAMLWSMTYPITLIIGLFAAMIARISGAWTAYFHAFLIPLYVTVFAIVVVMASVFFVF